MSHTATVQYLHHEIDIGTVHRAYLASPSCVYNSHVFVSVVMGVDLCSSVTCMGLCNCHHNQDTQLLNYHKDVPTLTTPSLSPFLTYDNVHSISTVLLFQKCSTSWIMQYVSFKKESIFRTALDLQKALKIREFTWTLHTVSLVINIFQSIVVTFVAIKLKSMLYSDALTF